MNGRVESDAYEACKRNMNGRVEWLNSMGFFTFITLIDVATITEFTEKHEYQYCNPKGHLVFHKN